MPENSADPLSIARAALADDEKLNAHECGMPWRLGVAELDDESTIKSTPPPRHDARLDRTIGAMSGPDVAQDVPDEIADWIVQARAREPALARAVISMAAEVERLRALVESAYDEGFAACVYRVEHGGVEEYHANDDWQKSTSRAALAAQEPRRGWDSQPVKEQSK